VAAAAVRLQLADRVRAIHRGSLARRGAAQQRRLLSQHAAAAAATAAAHAATLPPLALDAARDRAVAECVGQKFAAQRALLEERAELSFPVAVAAAEAAARAEVRTLAICAQTWLSEQCLARMVGEETGERAALSVAEARLAAILSFEAAEMVSLRRAVVTQRAAVAAAAMTAQYLEQAVASAGDATAQEEAVAHQQLHLHFQETLGRAALLEDCFSCCAWTLILLEFEMLGGDGSSDDCSPTESSVPADTPHGAAATDTVDASSTWSDTASGAGSSEASELAFDQAAVVWV
jgi:hypothetical protein